MPILAAPTDWTGWQPVVTPDTRLTAPDIAPELTADLPVLRDWIDRGVTDLPGSLSALRGSAEDLAEAMAQEVLARSEGLSLGAERWRRQRDVIRALAAQVIELAASDHAAREEIRRSLTVQLGDLGARFAEEIITLADAQMAAATRITTLEATSGAQQAKIQNVEVAMVDGYDALAAMISALSTGNALMLDHVRVWYFDSAAEGWTGTSGAPGVVAGWIRPAAGSNLLSPAGLGVNGAAYKQLRARIRRIGTPVWEGRLWWAGPSEGWDSARSMVIPAPNWDSLEEGYITFNAPWTGSIDRVRLDLVTGGDGVEVDWIAIGRPAPGASAAELLAERQARIAGDEALASDITALDARMGGAEGGLAAQAGAISGLEVRTAAAEGAVSAVSGRTDVLEAQVGDPETGLPGLSEAIDDLRATAMTDDGSQIWQSEALWQLRNAIRRVAAQGIEGAAVAHQQTRAVRAYIATASQDLRTRIDLTETQVTLLAEAVTLLQLAIPGLATADALQALTLRMSETEAGVVSQGNAITSLTNTIENPDTGLPGKASASALTGLGTTVSNQGGQLAALSEALTKLGVSLDGSTAEAILRLTAEVTPEGALARAGLLVAASGDEAEGREAALFLDALAGGKSRIVMRAGQVFILGEDGITPLFTIAGGQIRLASGLIRLDGAVEVDGSFRVNGPMIADGAVSRRVLGQKDWESYEVTATSWASAEVVIDPLLVAFEEDSGSNPLVVTLFGRSGCEAVPAQLNFMIERETSATGSDWTAAGIAMPYHIHDDTRTRHWSYSYVIDWLDRPHLYKRMRLRAWAPNAPVRVDNLSMLIQQVNR